MRACLFGVWLGCAIAAAAASGPRFLGFDDVEEILAAFNRTEDSAAWDRWIRAEDREVRGRIERGVEDSISNLVLYGTSFTKLARLESPEAALAGNGELIEPARSRVHEAAAALLHPGSNERLKFAREYLARRGVPPAEFEAVLGGNLKRFAAEQRAYQAKLRAAGDAHETLFVRATLFERRGLSVDTSLLPNYALEDTLCVMLKKGAIQDGHIRNIAVIGPGLDFADKREGYDFYPLQTIQPFAVMEAALRLGLAAAGGVRVVTFDLNAAVNAHLGQMAERARVGRAYVVQLPRDEEADWTPGAIAYWEHFGDLIGSPVTAAAAPSGLRVRAVAIKPAYASRIEPRDLNITAQVADGEEFDLVVATNILVYYDRFQQALAMTAIARMMRTGGVFLSNTVLPAQHPAALEYLGRRSVAYSASGGYGDDVVVYRRK